MNKIIEWLKRLFCRQKPKQKRVCEKIKVVKKFKKKNTAKGKK